MIIINADDFGMNESCSQAIAEAFKRGLVTNTTMMANGGYFGEAVKLAKERGFFDKIGIHLNITEGKPLTEDIKKLPDFVTDGNFNKQYDRARDLSPFECEAIYKELKAQVEKIENAGIIITRADSHHYVHNFPYIAPIAEKVCKEHGITKLRLMRNWGKMSETDRKTADSYRDGLRARGFETTDYFGRLSETKDTKLPDSIELLVHPDFDRDGNLIDRHGVEGGFPVGETIEKIIN